MDEEEDLDLDTRATLAGLRQTMEEMVSPSTTQSAQYYARRVLDEPNTLDKTEAELLGKVSENAEKTRKVLREARQRILARRYNPAIAWLSASAALGSPTRTGAIGESFANLSKSLIDPLKEKEQFEIDRDDAQLKYDQALGEVDERELATRLALLNARRGDSSRMRVKALDILGRRVPGGGTAAGPKSPFGKLAVDLLGDAAWLPDGRYSPQYYSTVSRLEAEDAKRRNATAGVDSTEVDPNDTASAASELGLPVLTLDPFRGLGTKQKAARMTRLEREAAETVAALEESSTGASEAIADAKRFIELNREVPTGGINRLGSVLGELPGAGPALKRGVEALSSIGDSEAQDMDALTAKLTPKMRAPGSGSSSNLDVQMFERATLSRSNLPATNRNIANAIIAQNQRVLEKKAFFNDYKSLYGHLEGAERYWREYLEANPIFDPEAGLENGEFKLNEQRQTYQEYFRSKTQPAEDDPALEGLTDEEREAALRPAMAKGGKVGLLSNTLESARKMIRGRNELRKRYHPRSNPTLESERQRLDALFENGEINEAEYEEALQAIESARLPSEHAEGGKVEVDEDPAFWQSVMEGLMQGASMGWADEVAVDPNEARGKLAESYEERPISSTAGEIGGVGVLLEAARQALLRSGMTPDALKMVPQAKLLALGRSMLLGAGAGAAWGAGASDPDSVAEDTGASAVRGAALGPLTGLAAKYGLVGLEKGYDRLRGRSVSGGEKAVLEALEADSMDPAGVQARMSATRRLGVPSSFGEEAGVSLDALQHRMASRTAANDRLTATADQRQTEQRSRVSDRVNQALAPSEFFAEERKLKDSLYQNAKPMYQAAYKKHPALKSKALMALLETPSGQRAARKAVLALKDRPGAKVGKTDITGMVQKPSLEYLDLVKRELDDMISVEERAGASGKGKRLRELRNALRDELDVLAPDYKAARAQYAGDLEVLDAIRSGREEFVRLQPKQLQEQLASMSFAEKDAYRSGVAQRLFEMIDKPTKDTNFAQRLIGSPAMAERLGLLFDSPKKAQVFQQALLKEAELFEKRRKTVSKGESNQAHRLGEDLPIPRRLWEVLERLRGPNEATSNEAGEILSASSADEVRKVTDNLQPKAQRLKARRARAGKAAVVGTIVGGALAAPDPAPKYREELEDGEER